MKKNYLLLIMLLCILVPTKLSATIYYVDAARPNNSGAGTSWATAYKDLQPALNIPQGPDAPDTIFVRKGKYYPTWYYVGAVGGGFPMSEDSTAGIGIGARSRMFYLSSEKYIFGGFAGNETSLNQRNLKNNATILSGDFNNDDVYSGSDTTFAVANKSENAGCIFRFKVVANFSSPFSNYVGIGPILDGFVIEGCYGRHPNNQDLNWGAIYAEGFQGSLTLRNLILYGNEGGYTGGIYFSAGKLNAINIVGINNYSSGTPFINGARGGILNIQSDSSAVIANCTFWGNRADDLGAAIRSQYKNENPSTKTDTIMNSILYKNFTKVAGAYTVGSISFGANNAADTMRMFLKNSIVQYFTNSGVLYSNVSTTYPNFKDTLNFKGPDGQWFTEDDGLSLMPGSAAINAGTSHSYLPTDLLGTNRIGIFDIGAYEYSNIPLAFNNISIYGINKGNLNEISWTSQSENIPLKFVLQHSTDCKTFTDIDIVQGNSIREKTSTYQFVDETIKKENFYRVLQYNADGSTQYSSVLKLMSVVAKNVIVYPNPVQDKFNINLDGTANVMITDYMGKAIYACNNYSGNEINTQNWAKGIYHILITDIDYDLHFTILKY